AALIKATPTIFSHWAAVNTFLAHHRNGESIRAPSASRISTNGIGPKSSAATRMNRNEAPQMAPSTDNSSGVRQRGVERSAPGEWVEAVGLDTLTRGMLLQGPPHCRPAAGAASALRRSSS